MSERDAVIKIGPYRGILSPGDFAWTGRKKPADLLKVGDLAQLFIQELRDNTVRVQLEQQPGPQGALLAIDNPTGEIKAMIGGYSFEDSKFNRATQALRQVGSSFKVYVYADALERGSTPFDTIVDLPFTTISGGQPYSPRNYDEKFEGTITLRRALAGSRNVPAVKLAEKVGINTVVDMTRRFGITTPLPPYLPLALGAADMKLLEHVSAFTVFPNDGIRIDPHMIRRVTSYDGALLEEAHPEVHDVVSPDVARTMTAMLEEVIQFGTGIAAKPLGRPPMHGSWATHRSSPPACGWGSTTNKFRSEKKKPAHAPRSLFGSNSCRAPSPEPHRWISRMSFPSSSRLASITSVWTPRIPPPPRTSPPPPKQNRQPAPISSVRLHRLRSSTRGSSGLRPL